MIKSIKKFLIIFYIIFVSSLNLKYLKLIKMDITRFDETLHNRWGDKTSYLKNVKCSGEPKNMAALTLYWMGQPSIYHATVALSFQIEICNLDRTKSSFLATSLYKRKFHQKLSTRSCRPSDILVFTDWKCLMFSPLLFWRLKSAILLQ